MHPAIKPILLFVISSLLASKVHDGGSFISWTLKEGNNVKNNT